MGLLSRLFLNQPIKSWTKKAGNLLLCISMTAQFLTQQLSKDSYSDKNRIWLDSLRRPGMPQHTKDNYMMFNLAKSKIHCVRKTRRKPKLNPLLWSGKYFFKAFLVCKAFNIKVINQGLIIGGKVWFNSILNIAQEKINMQRKLVVI